MDNERKESQWKTMFLLLVCVVAGVEIVMLVGENRSLRAELNHGEAAFAGDKGEEAIAVGDSLANWQFISADSDDTMLAFGEDEPHTVLLLHAAGCQVCDTVYPVWKSTLPSSAFVDGLRVISVQMDAFSASDTVALPFEHYLFDASAAENPPTSLKLPTTVLLNGQGTVERLWVGPLDAAAQSTLQDVVDKFDYEVVTEEGS